MKILILSHMYPRPGNEHYGVFVHESALALRERGHEILVVAPVPRTPPGLAWARPGWARLAALPERRELDGITLLHPRYLLLPRRIAFAGAAARMARSVLALDLPRDFDLLHAHAGVPDGGAARRIAAAMDLPYLVTSHGSDVLRMSHWSSSVHAELAAAFEKAAAVLFPSEKARQRAADRELRTRRGEVLWNGFDAERFLQEAPPAATDAPPRLITVANLVPSKRIDLLLHALARARRDGAELSLSVVGDGPERRRLGKLAEELKLTVDWFPALRREELAEMLCRSHIFALIAEGESFGIVYVEAMACGLAVIGTAGEGIADLIRDGENGFLVEAGDTDALAERLLRLSREPRLRWDLGSSAIADMAELDWSVHAERLESIYGDTLREVKG